MAALITTMAPLTAVDGYLIVQAENTLECLANDVKISGPIKSLCHFPPEVLCQDRRKQEDRWGTS